MTTPKHDREKAGEYWSKITASGQFAKKVSWGHSPVITEHISSLIYPAAPSSSPLMALFQRCKAKLGLHHFKKAVSVGAGSGDKEIALVKKGIVEHFTLYEVSLERINLARKAAKESGLEHKVNVRLVEGPLDDISDEYDLVFWCHSLHHMDDVFNAVEWSRKALSDGGVFLMYDFVGASRFQWSDEALRYASRARKILPTELLFNVQKPGEFVSTEVRRPPVDKLIARDPTEAADSDRIVDAITTFFPNPDFVFLGGCIYHLALNELIANFSTECHTTLLKSLLLLDQSLSETGINNFATCLAQKR